MIYDLIVIGAGSAGLFALANADSGIRAICLEKKPKAGIKLLMTGAEKCNLTSATNVKLMPECYNNPSFVRKILYSYSNVSIREYFLKLGVETVEIGDKVFPKSLLATTVLEALLKRIDELGHEIKYSEDVVSIDYSNSDYIDVITEKRNSRVLTKDNYICKSLIIATGGASYAFSGSDGKLIRKLFGESEIFEEFYEALTPIYTKEKYFENLSGVGLNDVKVKVGKKEYLGALLFAGEFLTGPAILNASGDLKQGDKFTISFLPQFDSNSLLSELKSVQAGSKMLKTVLYSILPLPQSLIDTILIKNDIKDVRMSECKKQYLNQIARDLTNLELEVHKKGGFNNAMVSGGGIKTDAVDQKTLSLKLDKRIKVIGEALDIHGITGGYNLTFAFSSAKLAVTTPF